MCSLSGESDGASIRAVSLRQRCVKARSAARSLDDEAAHARPISTGPDSCPADAVASAAWRPGDLGWAVAEARTGRIAELGTLHQKPIRRLGAVARSRLAEAKQRCEAHSA